MRSGFLTPRHGPTHRPPYQPGFGDHHRGWDRDHDRWRHGWYGGGFGYAYPGWTYVNPYPYVIDPWLDDWSDTSDYNDQPGAAANNYAPNPDYGAPYPQEPQQAYDNQVPYPQAPQQQPAPQQYSQPGTPSGGSRPSYAGANPASASVPEERLTLIFKDGRAPKSIRNYMMSTKELTDLDPQHYERIPLDQIDVGATAKANRANGVDFVVPGAVRD